MATSEDRPIIVSGGNQMITVTIPPAAKSTNGLHTLAALPEGGHFKKIVFTNDDSKQIEFDRPAAGNWTITIE